MKLYATILPLLLLAMWPSCESDSVLIADQKSIPQDCPEDLACTQVFAMVQLQLSDATGKPVVLDSYQSTNLETGRVYQFEEYAYGTQDGIYVVLTDNQLTELHKEGSSIEFIGYIGNKEVVRETYVIGHDCCHIRHISGDLDIKISAH